MIVHQYSLKGLRLIDYYNGIQSFINYALSNLRNISGNDIRYLFKRCKNKNKNLCRRTMIINTDRKFHR
jgi:hypothetical protein